MLLLGVHSAALPEHAKPDQEARQQPPFTALAKADGFWAQAATEGVFLVGDVDGSGSRGRG